MTYQNYGGQNPPPGGPQWNTPPPYAPAASTNGLAIAALVCAFLFAPLAIVLGHIARGQIKRTGEGGRGLATAGLVLGYIFTLASIVIVIISIGMAVWVVKNAPTLPTTTTDTSVIITPSTEP